MDKTNQRLAAWMKIEQLSDLDVAEKMGLDLSYVWRVRTGDRSPVPPSFAWRFAEIYGFDLAQKLFSEREPA